MVGDKTKAFLRIRGTNETRYRGMINMKRLILGVAAALMFSVGQAAADGLPSRGGVRDLDRPEAGTWNWTGFYLGAGVGGGAQVVNLGSDVGGEGAFGTVIIGYDVLVGPRLVVGVFADYDFSGISGDVLADNGDGTVSAITLDHNYSWSVGGRLGLLVNPATLVYGTGGYTQAEFELGGDPQTFDGYFVGGGIETSLRDNWFLKLEYRFSDHTGQDVDVDATLHTARATLTYKFPTRW
jgi:outer membrane immunogenic protein